MGCCPSKSRAERDTHDTLDSSILSTAAVAEKLQYASAAEVEAAVPQDAASGCSPCSSPQGSSIALLMDSGSGARLPKSDDDPTPSSPAPPAGATAVATVMQLQDSEFSGAAGLNDHKTNSAVDFEHESEIARPAEPTSAAMPPLSSSPRKAPVNYEEVPINSMYHRIHAVEAEAQIERRRQELREEAERHEREMNEFKASMLRP